MNTIELVVEIRPGKNSGPQGIWTHDQGPTVLARYEQWLRKRLPKSIVFKHISAR